MDKILSHEEAQEIRGQVNSFSTAVYNTTNAATKVINAFSNEAVVDSFFASGKYGKNEKETMENILKAINNYESVINSDGGLIKQTLNYLDTHTELVDTGSAGGSGGSSTGSSASTSGDYYGGDATNNSGGAGHSF